MRARKHSDFTKPLIGASSSGRTHTEETKVKITGRKGGVKVMALNTPLRGQSPSLRCGDIP
jgi:hypothetical protein